MTYLIDRIRMWMCKQRPIKNPQVAQSGVLYSDLSDFYNTQQYRDQLQEADRIWNEQHTYDEVKI